MIIISSGFPKSASTLLFLYTEHLILNSGKTRGQKMFRQFNSEGFTSWINPFNTIWFLFLSLFGPIVIKTHSGPNLSVRALLALGLAKAYYSIRDPRDVVLSALDHAAKAREKKIMSDSDKAFAPFKNRADLLPALQMHFERYKMWKENGSVLFLRYEQIMTHPETELRKIAAFTKRPELQEKISETVNHFASRKKETINFNKGHVERYTAELSSTEIMAIERDLGNVILEMGYSLSKA
jgi:hypothetical protein